MAQPTLYLMMGYPGAGKTTTSEIVAQLTGAVHLASDRIRLELFPEPQFTTEEHTKLYKEIDRRTEELLTAGKSVVYDANLNRLQHRKEKYEICKRTGTQPILLWVQADEQLARHRATISSDGDPKRPYGNLDDQTFSRLVREIEPPVASEPHIVVDGTKVTNDYVRQQLNLA